MKIAFDIDDVLANFMSSLLSFASPLLHKNYTEDDMTYQTHYGEIWGVSLEEAIKIVGKFYRSKEFKYVLSNPDAHTLIQYLADKKVKIIAITSRPDFIKQSTLDWLDENFPGIFSRENVYFTNKFYGEKQTKGSICKQLGVDYLVEDDIPHVNSCIENKCKVFLYNKPWNKNFQDKFDLVTRINNLKNIIDLV